VGKIALRLPLHKNDAAWSLFFGAIASFQWAQAHILLMLPHLSPKADEILVVSRLRPTVRQKYSTFSYSITDEH